MATIVVEDGSGLTNSNSYISEAELSTYATDRGVTISGTPAVLLIQAMDYLEQQNFIGVKNNEDQALQWPRYNASLYGYLLEPTEMPQLLKDTQAEFALAIDGGNNPMSNLDRATKKEKVGDIEVEYMDGARNEVYLKGAELKLSKLLRGGAGAGSMSAVAYRG